MKNQQIIIQTIAWSARISGTAILMFFLYFLIAHVFEIDGTGIVFTNTSEILTFIFFPVGVIVGLGLALKWELLGGIITLSALVGLFVMRFDLITNYLLLLPVFPAILYIIYSRLR